jgi:hypothetical protein
MDICSQLCYDVASLGKLNVLKLCASVPTRGAEHTGVSFTESDNNISLLLQTATW